jgi:HSP20 family protein
MMAPPLEHRRHNLAPGAWSPWFLNDDMLAWWEQQRKTLVEFQHQFNRPFFDILKPLGSNGDVGGRHGLIIDDGEKEITLKLGLDGVDPAKVHVSVCDDVLTVEGESKVESTEVAEGRKKESMALDRFTRSVWLSSPIDVVKAKAVAEADTLTIVLPKTVPKKHDSHLIPIVRRGDA